MSDNEYEEVERKEDDDLFTEMDFVSLFLKATSCALDSVPSSIRNETMNMACEIIGANSDKCIQELGSGLALKAANSCRSLNSMKRVARLLVCCLKSASSWNTESEDDAGVVKGLCFAVCRLLTRSKNESLLRECISQLSSSSFLCPIFTSILHDQANAASKGFVYSTAASLASSTSNSATPTDQLLELLLKCILGGSKSSFASASHIVPMAKPFFGTLTSDQWSDVLLPTCDKKLRANPEGCLETVNAIFSCCSTNLTSSTTEVMEGLATIGVKQLKSSKSNIQSLACEFLTLLSNNNNNSIMVSQLICQSLSSKKITASSFTQPDQRMAAYTVLTNIAQQQQQQQQQNLETKNSCELVLSTLSNGVLTKEISSSPSQKEGFLTLFTWMRLSKKQNDAGADAAYKKNVIPYLSEPIHVAASAKQQQQNSDFRSLFGTLLLSPFTHPHLISQDFVDSVITDIFQNDTSALKKSIQSILDGATKKFTKSDSVPQIDGVVATYLSLIVSSTSNDNNIQGCVEKVLSTGTFATSASQKLSFLYSKSIRDAVATDPLAGYLLPRIIAMYTKLQQQSNNDNKQLIRLIVKEGETTKKVSAAAHLLACCIANPHHVPVSIRNKPNAPSTIQSSIQTILTYSPASVADALISATLSHVNTQSMEYTKLQLLSNNNPPRDDTTTKLEAVRGKGSVTADHKGFDPNTVRRIAMQLVQSCSPTMDSLVKAILLSHISTTLKVVKSRQRNALVAATTRILESHLLPLLNNSDDKNSKIANFSKFIVYCCISSSSSFIDSVLLNDIETLSLPSSTTNEEDTKNDEKNGQSVMSEVVQQSALSLVTSLGIMGGNFDPAYDDPEEEDIQPFVFSRNICVNEICPLLASNLQQTLEQVEELSVAQVTIYRSLNGIATETAPDTSSSKSSSSSKVITSTKSATSSAAGKKNKKKGGSLFEEEDWEKQMKKEMAAKKRAQQKQKTTEASSSSSTTSSPQEGEEKTKLSNLLDGQFISTLAAIRTLCGSDIEVGNACLLEISTSVIAAAVSTCDVLSSTLHLKKACWKTLHTLASCVYEIDEDASSDNIARALIMSCERTKKDQEKTATSSSTMTKLSHGKSQLLSIIPLPSSDSDNSAGTVIELMDVYNDDDSLFSGPSFSLLFPIIRAALTGPRTNPGCEAALRILDRHICLIDDASTSPTLRKDMAHAVLELLCHDRAQTFHDPTPFQTLISIYQTTNKLSSTDLAPLLGDIGALGGTNGRLASMMALASIAEKQPKLCKTNPLVENRIWMNCFSNDENIRQSARQAWGGNLENLSPPSKMFLVPMLPLLSHSDSKIVNSAADALAYGMGKHADSMEKNITRLCSLYIDSYPTVFDDDTKNTSGGDNVSNTASSLLPKPPTEKKSSVASLSSAPKKKPTIVTGLPKKTKTSSKGSSSIAALTTTKKKAPSKKVRAALAPKPKERTLDQDFLAAQFKPKSEQIAANVEIDNIDKIAVRRGVLRAIASITDASINNIQLELGVLQLLVSFLSAFCLADGNEQVRDQARNATRDVVATNGGSEKAIAFLLPHFETVLSTGKADLEALSSLNSEKVIQTTAASDRRKEGVVVALGSVALHLKDDENADKIDNTIDMLIDALGTPSVAVQSSVALCLSKLMKKGRVRDRIESILQGLLKQCLDGEKLSIRRGGAYGISAVVKGSGIASLKKYEIVKRLEEAITSGSSDSKEGALFAIEQLSDRLGLLFEPYVIVLLPSLLKAFSDNSNSVREAAAKAAGLIMSRLSAHGVKLVMPAVLSAFDEPEWRTKQASIHMLGAMSHCAPKQLASCLPKVVPKLTEAFSDTHPKVKASAEEALDEISNVIRNPEISSISKVLLKALTDPAQGTVRALESLIETEFLHAIDAPSLALIVPVIHRGLRDRLATTKRYGALIAGNICTMINDPRDFVPYLSILLPDLKTVLLDPIPDVRSTSAKALGSLTRSLGEATFPELRPWLIQTLRSEEGTSVERSGAAQGLTEVLSAGGATLVETVMKEEILPLKSYPKASTREGVLWVLTFMPTSIGQAFAPLIDSSFPALISGLSDESEPVREVAMRAGRVMIRSHGKAHLDKILPSLESGLWDEDYRIRVASLMLLGDLLSMIGGTKVLKGDGDTQEDIRQAERAQAQIAIVLGPEKRKRVLSSLYIRRNDTAAVVRQNAVQVWKTVVSVTPRTLREILDVLVGQIVSALASGIHDQTEVAGRCLGDIVRKLGDAVLPEIIPVLRDSLYSDDDQKRRGACVGLSEVIACSSKEQIEKYLNIFVKVVQNALCDDDEGVREMAASCFQNLHNTVGNRAFDEVVPVLLVAMDSSAEDHTARSRAIVGLTCILSIRSRELLPYLVPRLIQKPITKSHADALSSIAQVTGGTIHLFFNTIIPSLINELASFDQNDISDEEKEREDAIRDCTKSIYGSVDEPGVNSIVGQIASLCNSDKESVRAESSWMIQTVVEERKDKMDFYEQIPIMLRDLLNRMNDPSPRVVKAANSSLGVLSKHVPAEELVKHVEFIRNLIASIVSDARRRKGGVGDGEFFLPGINMPKGLDPFLPIFQRGILYGDSNIRETSAAGLGELITLTAKKYLAGPSTIKMTGPLLRIVGDRNPAAVKVAIINTLGLILTKGGPALRAFVPQFQTTFVKALSDPSRQVRLRAIESLALLMPLSTRLDPLIKELVSTSLGKGTITTVESAGKVAIQTASLEALSIVLKHGGKKAKLPESIPSALEAGKEMLAHEDEGVREAAAKVLAATCGLVDQSDTLDIVQDIIIKKDSDDSSDFRHGQAICCFHLFSVGSQIDIPDDLFDKSVETIIERMSDENTLVREAACQAIGALIGTAPDYRSCFKKVQPTVLKCMDTKENTEVLKSLAKGLCVAVRMNAEIFEGKEGLKILDAALKNSMQCTQRVQLAFNNFLWLALDVEHGESGLARYAEMAMFENVKSMKSLYSKILVRIKSVEL